MKLNPTPSPPRRPCMAPGPRTEGGGTLPSSLDQMLEASRGQGVHGETGKAGHRAGGELNSVGGDPRPSTHGDIFTNELYF